MSELFHNDEIDVRKLTVEQPKLSVPAFQFDPRTDMPYFNWQEVKDQAGADDKWLPGPKTVKELLIIFPELAVEFDIPSWADQFKEQLVREQATQNQLFTEYPSSLETAKRLFPGALELPPPPLSLLGYFERKNNNYLHPTKGLELFEVRSWYDYLANLYLARVCFPEQYRKLLPPADLQDKLIKSLEENAGNYTSALKIGPHGLAIVLYHLKATMPEAYQKLKLAPEVRDSLLHELEGNYDFLIHGVNEDAFLEMAACLKQLAMGDVVITDNAIYTEEWSPKARDDETPDQPERRRF
jgi:hypothetical protein